VYRHTTRAVFHYCQNCFGIATRYQLLLALPLFHSLGLALPISTVNKKTLMMMMWFVACKPRLVVQVWGWYRVPVCCLSSVSVYAERSLCRTHRPRKGMFTLVWQTQILRKGTFTLVWQTQILRKGTFTLVWQTQILQKGTFTLVWQTEILHHPYSASNHVSFRRIPCPISPSHRMQC